ECRTVVVENPAARPDAHQAVRFRSRLEPCDRGGGMDILYLLDQLEEVLGAGSRLPLTSRTLVDEPEILDILDQIRVSIPEEVKAGRRLTQERDQVISDARAEAERI